MDYDNYDTTKSKLRRAMSVDLLIEQLKASDTTVQVEAARQLGTSRSPEAFVPLIEALHDPDREVRKAAVEALGDLGDVRAIEPLIELSDDEVLSDLEEDWQLPSPIEHVLIDFGPAAVEKLIEYVDKPMVMVALGQIGDSRAFEPLMHIIETPDLHSVYDISWAISALGSLKDPRAFDTLAFYVRYHVIGHSAIAALGSLGDMRAIPILEVLLYRPVVHRLHYAAWALAHIGTDEALESLIEYVQQAPTRYRIQVLDVLMYSKNPRAEKFFSDILHSVDDEVGWKYAINFFLAQNKLQFLEELIGDVPEVIATAIRRQIERFK